MLNPYEDGITHINIYSRSKTDLGRFLTNFAYCPIETEDGRFNSIEGYWGYLGINENIPQRERLRDLYGYNAKKFKEDLYKLDNSGRFDERFKEKITKAVLAKLSSPKGQKILEENRDLLNLPLEHYYCFFSKKDNTKYNLIDVKHKYEFFVNAVKTGIDNFLEKDKTIDLD